jgi:site-specific recombinase XerD
MTSKQFSAFLAAQQFRAGALREQIGMVATALAERGYSLSTTREQVRLVAHLGRWLHRRHLSAADLDEACVARFLAHRRRCRRKPRSSGATLRLVLEMLRAQGAVARPLAADASDVGPVARIECEFARYLVDERGLSASTLANYLPGVRRLLSRRFGTGPVKLTGLHQDDITRFIMSEARTVSPGRMKVVVPGLRAFLRWLHLRGETSTDLTGCVPKVADWRLATLPKSIPTEQVEHLLRCCDRTTVIGCRDHAILLLLARLGLRAGEVVAMELDDVDWEAGELLVRGKGGRRERLPLSRDVGTALATYLRCGRPTCSLRRVFVRAKAPWRGFASSVAICDLVRRALRRAGLEPPRKGAHLLRHALACTMLRRGASLPEIGEVLRHRSLDTTALYAKVDVLALHALAPAWPSAAGGA